MASGDIKLIIDYQNGNIKSVTSEAEKEFSASGKKAGAKFSSSFGDSLKTAAGSIAKIGAAAAAIGGIALFKSIKDAAQLEVISTKFEVMLKSAAAAKAQVEELQQFAASTPFQLTGLAESTTQLLSFGVAQKQILPTLKTLGDLAAGVGVDIADLTIPFGRLRSTQKLTLIELDKFADKGINLYGQLAKQTGISLKTIRQDISQGRIPYEEFTTALQEMTGENGLFFEGMKKQSRTLTGVISTLGDNLFNLSANFGKAFSPIVIRVAEKIIVALQRINKQVTDSFNVFEDVIDPILAVGTTITEYVIPPMELLANIGKFVFDALKAGVAATVADFGFLGGKIAELLGAIGLNNDFTKGLRDFAETSKAVANEAAVDVKKSLTGMLDFPASEVLATKNEAMIEYFAEQREIIEAETAITKEAVEVAQTEAVESTQTFGKLLGDTFSGVKIGVTKTAEEMTKISKQSAKIVQGGLAKGVSGGIQNIIQSLAKGEDVFANFGNFLVGMFGDLAIQLGNFWIAQGIAVVAADAVSGTGAIAAGIALVAVGSLLKAFSGGGGGGAAPSAAAAPATSFQADTVDEGFADEGSQAQAQTILNVNVDGNVNDGGAFIRDLAEQIGEESDKQGIVFNNLAVV